MPGTLDESGIVELQVSRTAKGLSASAFQGSGKTQYGHVDAIECAHRSFRLSVGYRRCFDFDENDAPGQDAACFRASEQHLIGVVADGVSQSFYGNLAARHLCDWLVDELWQRRRAAPNETVLEEGLREQEKCLAAAVREVSLSHLLGLQRSALEKTREAGSQAVFAAFLWDCAADILHVYQLGDVRALVRVSAGRAVQIAPGDPKGRWSSAGRSHLGVVHTQWRDVAGVLLASDGAGSSWGRDFGSRSSNAQAFFQMAQLQAENDDVSFVVAEVRASAGAPVTTINRESQADATLTSESSTVCDTGRSISSANRPAKAKSWWVFTNERSRTIRKYLLIALVVMLMVLAARLLMSRQHRHTGDRHAKPATNRATVPQAPSGAQEAPKKSGKTSSSR